jgi:hypothetical protein
MKRLVEKLVNQDVTLAHAIFMGIFAALAMFAGLEAHDELDSPDKIPPLPLCFFSLCLGLGPVSATRTKHAAGCV